MRKTRQTSGERIVKDIKHKTRKQYSAEEKIRIVLDGLRGRESVGELCRIEGISQGLYYNGPKTFWRLGRNGAAQSHASVARLHRRKCLCVVERPCGCQYRGNDISMRLSIWLTALGTRLT